MNKVIRTLIKKEILDVFRDKKAVIMMLVVPLILYPLLFFGVLTVMTSIQTGMAERQYIVVLDCEDEDLYSLIADWKIRNTDEENQTVESAQFLIKTASDYEDLEEALQQEKLDAYIQVEEVEGKRVYRIHYLSTVTNSLYAEELLEDVLQELMKRTSEELLLQEGFDAEQILKPVLWQGLDGSTGEQSVGSMLGTVVPFLLIISLLMGTMYPAIDTTSGEKERGTLETLLTLPVTNRDIIVSKFFTVALVGVISALLNVISMGFMGFYIVKLLAGTEAEEKLFGDVHLSSFVPAILITILCVLVFSLFISAITMCVTSFAKSYKEANNYITPLTLVVMLTGYIGFIPNLELNRNMALIPVANMVLLIKNLLLFKLDWEIVVLVLFSNIIYAAIAIFFLGRIYSSESILFDDGLGGIRVFERRENIKQGGTPTNAEAWLVLFVVMLLVIYLGSLLQMRYGTGGVFGTQMIILMIPLIVSFYTKCDFKKTYHVTSPGVFGLIGSVFLVLGTILIGIVLTALFSGLFPEAAENTSSELTKTLYGDSFVIAWMIVALCPAICEEMMFRGFVYSGFRSKMRPWSAILLVGAVFGLYHMSLVRFFTISLLGAALCFVVYTTGSIVPAMLMHCLNNTAAVLQIYYPEELGQVLPILQNDSMGIPEGVIVLVSGGVFLAGGIVTLLKVKELREKYGNT